MSIQSVRRCSVVSRPARWALALCMGGLAMPALSADSSVTATPLAAVGSPTGDARDLRAWLMKIHTAAARKNFQGTFVVSAGGTVSSARLSHYVDGEQQFERIESLDGEPRVVLRHGDVVQTVWPLSKVVMQEQRDLQGAFPALLKAGDDHIADHYDISVQGHERLAGQDAQVLLLRPRDAYRFALRLWADRATGLLLRSDVLNERGEVLESSAFSEVSINVKAQPESVLALMKKAEGYRQMRSPVVPIQLDAEGWVFKRGVPGFREVRSVKRPLDASNAHAQGALKPGAQVVQTVLSDGLTYVSVFIEPYAAEHRSRPMLTSLGATHTLMRRQGDWWVTVVGDVPAGTLRLLANGLERKTP